MSEINEQVNFDNMMEKIQNTMNEINFLEKSKKSLEKFYTRFLTFIIIVNHFHVLIDTNHSLVSMMYNTIDNIEDTEEEYEIVDYAQGLEIEEVD